MMNEEKNISMKKIELKVQKGAYWWEAEGLRFECRQCGACCGGEPGAIWVTADETRAIAEFLSVDDSELRQKYLTRNMGRNSIKEQKNYDCVFLKRNLGLCGIYKARPLQCRLFPFWPSILGDKNIWNYYAAKCSGMNRGKLYTQEMIKSLQSVEIWQDL